MAARVGGVFTSFTITVKDLVSLNTGEPLSVTRTVMLLVLGPWASVGVHVNAPDDPLIVAPDGAPGSRLNVNVCAGTSASVAVAVKLRSVPSLIVWFEIGFSAGALFTSLTIIVKERA